MSETGKTSTFTIHHDRCDPSKWTIAQWKLFADFVRTRSLQNAAGLSRLGVQLVLSDAHEPTGGTLERIGWAQGEEVPCDYISDDLTDIADEDITPVVEMYRGPTRYAVRYAIDDGHGAFGGYEFEIKDSEAEAQEYLKSLQESAEVTAA